MELNNDFINEEDNIKLVCNKCKNNIKKNAIGYFDDYVQFEKRWGYHSPYDNEIHKFNLCNECYKKIIEDFLIPISIEN